MITRERNELHFTGLERRKTESNEESNITEELESKKIEEKVNADARDRVRVHNAMREQLLVRQYIRDYGQGKTA